jgi:hypothetical protein
LLCKQCHNTFTVRKGTAFYWVRTPAETVSLGLTLLAQGGPLQAIVVAFGFEERTVAAWFARAGRQAEAAQEHCITLCSWFSARRSIVGLLHNPSGGVQKRASASVRV